MAGNKKTNPVRAFGLNFLLEPQPPSPWHSKKKEQRQQKDSPRFNGEAFQNWFAAKFHLPTPPGLNGWWWPHLRLRRSCLSSTTVGRFCVVFKAQKRFRFTPQKREKWENWKWRNFSKTTKHFDGWLYRHQSARVGNYSWVSVHYFFMTRAGAIASASFSLLGSDINWISSSTSLHVFFSFITQSEIRNSQTDLCRRWVLSEWRRSFSSSAAPHIALEGARLITIHRDFFPLFGSLFMLLLPRKLVLETFFLLSR